MSPTTNAATQADSSRSTNTSAKLNPPIEVPKELQVRASFYLEQHDSQTGETNRRNNNGDAQSDAISANEARKNGYAQSTNAYSVSSAADMSRVQAGHIDVSIKREGDTTSISANGLKIDYCHRLQRFQVDLNTDVTFDFDKATLRPSARQSLDQFSDNLNLIKSAFDKAGVPFPAIELNGHTDVKGPQEYNQTLSEKRSAAVKEYLEQKIPGVEFSAKGYGETHARADTHDYAGRAFDRRVSANIGVDEKKVEEIFSAIRTQLEIRVQEIKPTTPQDNSILGGSPGPKSSTNNNNNNGSSPVSDVGYNPNSNVGTNGSWGSSQNTFSNNTPAAGSNSSGLNSSTSGTNQIGELSTSSEPAIASGRANIGYGAAAMQNTPISAEAIAQIRAGNIERGFEATNGKILELDSGWDDKLIKPVINPDGSMQLYVYDKAGAFNPQTWIPENIFCYDKNGAFQSNIGKSSENSALRDKAELRIFDISD